MHGGHEDVTFWQRWRAYLLRPARLGMMALLAIGVAQALLVIFWYRWNGANYVWANYGFAIEIGLLVGSTELISRYRDDPFAPLISTPGAFYILINGGAAALANYLMGILQVPLEEPMRTLAAGFGAMAFFRSGLFTVRIGGTDIAVGPNIVLFVILQALDRSYDRARATPRSMAVSEIMAGIGFAQVKGALPTLCFNLMQNVSDAERSAINAQISDLSDPLTPMADDAKVLSLGLALFNVVGEDTLRAAVGALGSQIKGYQQVGGQLLVGLARIDPRMVVATLPEICGELPSAATGKQPAAWQPIDPAVCAKLTPESLAIVTLYRLVAHYGDQRVGVAVGILANQAPIQPPPAPPPPPPPPDENADQPPTEPTGQDQSSDEQGGG